MREVNKLSYSLSENVLNGDYGFLSQGDAALRVRNDDGEIEGYWQASIEKKLLDISGENRQGSVGVGYAGHCT